MRWSKYRKDREKICDRSWREARSRAAGETCRIDGDGFDWGKGSLTGTTLAVGGRAKTEIAGDRGIVGVGGSIRDPKAGGRVADVTELK